MSFSPPSHPSLHPIPSQVVKRATDIIPSTEQIEAQEAKLTELHPHTLELARKGDGDLRTIQESTKKSKENENDEAKLVEKTERKRV
jgi:hypothetical protein